MLYKNFHNTEAKRRHSHPYKYIPQPWNKQKCHVCEDRAEDATLQTTAINKILTHTNIIHFKQECWCLCCSGWKYLSFNIKPCEDNAELQSKPWWLQQNSQKLCDYLLQFPVRERETCHVAHMQVQGTPCLKQNNRGNYLDFVYSC